MKNICDEERLQVTWEASSTTSEVKKVPSVMFLFMDVIFSH